MPEIGRIQSTTFQSLLTDLGITRNNIPFGLQSEVMPVVLVGGTVSFLAAPTPAYDVVDIFTQGELTAPAVNTIMATTGPLPIGPYSIQFVISSPDRLSFDFQWRDAGDAANLWAMQFGNTAEIRMIAFETRLNILNSNERFRILNAEAGTAAVVYQATILAKI